MKPTDIPRTSSAEVDLFCETLKKLVAAHEHQRIGQVIDNAVAFFELELYYIENDKLVEALVKYINPNSFK